MHIRMTHDDDRHPHNPRHMLETARVCERMRVYVYRVDGLYRRAELNKHAHCIRVPALAREHQRCGTVFLRALAGDYSIEVTIGLDEREHAHEYIYTCQYMHMYTHAQTSPMCADTKKKRCIHRTYTYVYI